MSIRMNDHGYPTFTAQEYAWRRDRLSELMLGAEVDLTIVYGERGAPAVSWVTGWFPTHAAWAFVAPRGPVKLMVQRFNHVATAERMVTEDVRVEFGGPEGLGTFLAEVRDRTVEAQRIGWVGPLSHSTFHALESIGRTVVPLSSEFQQLRAIKSGEEIAWMRIGAELTDLSLEALLDALGRGVTEWEAIAAVESAYVGHGGTNHLHYVASTSMSAPSRYVPAQWPSSRRILPGDAVVTELSASYWGYPGQLLRTIAVGDEPSGLFAELHEVAVECFDRVAAIIRPGTHAAELVDAASFLNDAGYVLGDDLLHGFGGGYLPPVLRTRADEIDPIPDMALESGMTVVLQPNVCTPDRRAGVQTGELLLVTKDGFERLHQAPTGLLSA